MSGRKTALWPLQVSIFQRLKNDTNVTKKASVHDSVSANTPMPYITIGEDNSVPYDTKTSYGEEIDHMIYVYSSYSGKKEVKEIMNAILESISSKPLEIEGGFFVEFDNIEMMEVTEVNGSPVKRGVMRFNFIIRQGE